MGLSTQRLTTVFMPEQVLAASWWPLRLQEGLDDKSAKALVLWLNGTLGILLFAGSRAETAGAWVKFKKPTLHALPVLNVRQLTQHQLTHLSDTFDRLANQLLQPLSQLADDPVRKAIDDAISEALGLPDLTALRSQLAHEPVLTLQSLRQRLLAK